MTAVTVDRGREAQQLLEAKARKQVLHPVNLPALLEGLQSHNHGRRRRSERALLRAVRRGVVRKATS